jgi:hypothetical protein
VSGGETAVSDAQTDSENGLFMPKAHDNGAVSGVSGGFEEGDGNSVVCIHELNPAACNVCNGTVRRLIEERATV